MNNWQRRTVRAIFEHPERADIRWSDIENMLQSCGAKISEGRGSRVRIALNGSLAVFHRPHPKKVTGKGAVRSMRRFLNQAGIKP